MPISRRSSALTATILGNDNELSPARAEDQISYRDLPSFLIIGPPRTGTTWLHEVLSSRVRLPEPTKETRFFDRHFDRGIDWYLRKFPEARDDRPVGEVAPTYFASPAARDRIAQLLPHAKLVIIFRHPVQRLVSMYRMKRAYGIIGWSLDEALERDPEMIASSQYATHLREWQNQFGADQIRISLYEELSADPQCFIDGVTQHIGVPHFTLEKQQLQQVFSAGRMTAPKSQLATRAATSMADWCKARRFDSVVAGVRNSSLLKLFIGGGAPFPDVPSHTLARITDLVTPEIEALEGILNTDLTAWKSSAAS